jgi:hypothetical protein
VSIEVRLRVVELLDQVEERVPTRIWRDAGAMTSVPASPNTLFTRMLSRAGHNTTGQYAAKR